MTELLGLIELLKAEAEEKGEGSEDGDGAEGDMGDAGATMVEDKDTSVEKLSDSAEESDASKLEPNKTGATNCVSKGNCKRNRAVSPKAGKTKKVEDDDGNNSPANPLHLSADH